MSNNRRKYRKRALNFLITGGNIENKHLIVLMITGGLVSTKTGITQSVTCINFNIFKKKYILCLTLNYHDFLMCKILSLKLFGVNYTL